MKITKNERLQLIGLLTLAREHQKMVDQCDEAMNEITETECGSVLSDAIYNELSVKEILNTMDIKVANKMRRSKKLFNH